MEGRTFPLDDHVIEGVGSPEAIQFKENWVFSVAVPLFSNVKLGGTI